MIVKKVEIQSLEKDLQDEKIWSDRDKSLLISKKKSSIEKDLNEFSSLDSEFTQLEEFKELYDEDHNKEIEDI